MSSASSPPRDEKSERGDDVAEADLLVIDRAQKALETPRTLPQLQQARRVRHAVGSEPGSANVSGPQCRVSR